LLAFGKFGLLEDKFVQEMQTSLQAPTKCAT